MKGSDSYLMIGWISERDKLPRPMPKDGSERIMQRAEESLFMSKTVHLWDAVSHSGALLNDTLTNEHP